VIKAVKLCSIWIMTRFYQNPTPNSSHANFFPLAPILFQFQYSTTSKQDQHLSWASHLQ